MGYFYLNINSMKFFFFFIASFISFSIMAQTPVQAPEIKLPDAKNQLISTASLKGKVVLIDFWASWCKPCRRTVPGLKKIYASYKQKGFEIYGISLDDNKNAWKKAVFDDGIPWIQVNDAAGNVAQQWHVQFIPNTFLLNKQGEIIAVNMSEEELEALLQKLLG